MLRAFPILVSALVLFTPAAVAQNKQASRGDPASITPLTHAHAHNDYEHKRPLLDALDNGFGSVEADIFLHRGQLLVGHTFLDLRPERTLQKLYLDPLRRRIQENGGKVYKNGPAFWLLIDVKTEAKPTCQALHQVLAGYDDILSVVKDGKLQKKAINVVVTGNRAIPEIKEQNPRFGGIDGRLGDLDSTDPAHLMPWISSPWSSTFRWNGEGAMPEAERARLKEYARKAHAHGRLLRFWGTPEKTAVWRELRAADVDLINTDDLAGVRAFLNSHGAATSK